MPANATVAPELLKRSAKTRVPPNARSAKIRWRQKICFAGFARNRTTPVEFGQTGVDEIESNLSVNVL
jgi:hypothetical protein